MTVEGLKNWRTRHLAVAIKLLIVGRKEEAEWWRSEADRYASAVVGDARLRNGGGVVTINCESIGCDWCGFPHELPAHQLIDHDNGSECPVCQGFGVVARKDGTDERCYPCRGTGRVQ